MKKRRFRVLLCLGLFAMTLTSCGNINPYANDPRYPIYQLALADGFIGTYQQWLDSIKGEDGENGQTPHIGENGNWWIGDTDTGVPATGPQGPAGSDGQPGSQGEPGKDGVDGQDGKDGTTPHIGDNGNWWIGDQDTGIPATGADGQDGQDGADGKDGKDGQDGQPGSQGPVGPEGPEGPQGEPGKDGTSMHTGHGAPSDLLGQVGDSYVDLDTWDFYVKYENGWVLEGNIKGSDATSTPDHEGTEGLEFYPLNDTECAVGAGNARYLENIIIPSKYKQYTVTQIGVCGESESDIAFTFAILNSFSACENLKTVTLPDTITTIGNYAFNKCTKLTTINFPDSVTSIGGYAFNECSSLNNITFGTKLNTIGRDAFSYCTSLTSITIPGSVATIGYNAFSSCSSLKSVNIEEGVYSIGQNAFRFCDSIEKVLIPESVLEIGESAFYINGKAVAACRIAGLPENWHKYWKHIKVKVIWGYKDSFEEIPDYDNVSSVNGGVQGVTAEKILVGNTAATTGAFATVGMPFNRGLEIALNSYNLSGGYNGAKVEFIHYDDEFDGTQASRYTQQLVEKDQVFAIVGHFGTNTVASTINYIKATGIPMVYAASGINDLYQEGATGSDKSVMPVQPIYKTEGRVLLARAAAKAPHGFGATNIGVIYTSDDAGLGMVDGVRRQAQEASSALTITYSETNASLGTNHASAVAKVAGADLVIICANQTQFGEILNYMRDVNVDKPVITSYVSANINTLGALAQTGSIAGNRQVYTTAWLDITTEKGHSEYMEFSQEVFLTYGISDLNDTSHPSYYDAFALASNSYTLVGYMAGTMFVEGLKRVDESQQELTWDSYIDAMESMPVKVPFGDEIDYSNGNRLGTTSFSMNTYDPESQQLKTVYTMASLDEVWNAATNKYNPNLFL